MEKCPECGCMTAERSHSTGILLCYNRYCMNGGWMLIAPRLEGRAISPYSGPVGYRMISPYSDPIEYRSYCKTIDEIRAEYDLLPSTSKDEESAGPKIESVEHKPRRMLRPVEEDNLED